MNEFLNKKFSLKDLDNSVEKDALTFGSEDGSNQNLKQTFSASGSESKDPKKKSTCPLESSLDFNKKGILNFVKPEQKECNTNNKSCTVSTITSTPNKSKANSGTLAVNQV